MCVCKWTNPILNGEDPQESTQCYLKDVRLWVFDYCHSWKSFLFCWIFFPDLLETAAEWVKCKAELSTNRSLATWNPDKNTLILMPVWYVCWYYSSTVNQVTRFRVKTVRSSLRSSWTLASVRDKMINTMNTESGVRSCAYNNNVLV